MDNKEFKETLLAELNTLLTQVTYIDQLTEIVRQKSMNITELAGMPDDLQNHRDYANIRRARYMSDYVRKPINAREKTQINITGTLANVLVIGMPAVYLYHGNLIRTTAVKAIMEAAPGHVCFETSKAIYTLSYGKNVSPEAKTA